MTEQKSKVLIRILAVVAGLVGLCVVAWSWFAFRPTGIGKLEAMVAVTPRSSPTIVSGGVPTIILPDGNAVAPPPEVLPPEAVQLLARMARHRHVLGVAWPGEPDEARIDRLASAWLPITAEWEFFPHETSERDLLEAAVRYAASLNTSELDRTLAPFLAVRMYRDLSRGRDEDAMTAFRMVLSRSLDHDWGANGLLALLTMLAESPHFPPVMLDEMEAGILLRMQEIPPLETRLPRIMEFRESALKSLENPRTGQGVLGIMWNGVIERTLQTASAPLVEKEIEVLCVAWADRNEKAFDASAKRLTLLTEMAGSSFNLPSGHSSTSHAKDVFAAELPDPDELEMILFYLSAIRFRNEHARWPEVHELSDLERLGLVEDGVEWRIHHVEPRTGIYVDSKRFAEYPHHVLNDFRRETDRWPRTFEELAAKTEGLDPEEWKHRFRELAGRPTFACQVDDSIRIIIPQIFSDELKALLAGEGAE